VKLCIFCKVSSKFSPLYHNVGICWQMFNVKAVEHMHFTTNLEWRVMKYSSKSDRYRAMACKPLLSRHDHCEVFDALPRFSACLKAVDGYDQRATLNTDRELYWDMKAGLTNEILGSTVTRQPNVQTPPTHFATTILSQAVYISGSYSNPNCCLPPFFQCLFTRPFHFP
jgi:hypothetical protein